MVKENFNELSRVYKLFSRIVALLPFEGRGFDFIVTRFLTILMATSEFICVALLLGYVIDTHIQGRTLKVENIYIAILGTSGFLRYCTLLFTRKDYASLFQQCAKLWEFCNNKGRQTVKHYESKIRRFYGIYFANCLVMNILLPIGAYMTKIPPVEPNGTERRILPHEWYVGKEPFDYYLGYHTTFIIQTIIIQNCIVVGMVTDAMFSVFTMLGAGYFHQLTERLDELSQYDDDDDKNSSVSKYNEIMQCVEYHQRLLNYCYDLRQFARTVLLMQITAACYCISLVLIKLVGTEPDKYNHLSIMALCMCQMFVVQWTPDSLADANEGVAFATYSLLMKRLSDKRLRRNLYIMLMKAQIPMKLTAGGFIVLSFENYAKMMNHAFSFFMVLRTLDVQ